MTFWLDEQFDLKVAKFLSASFGIDVRTTWALGLRETDDAIIFQLARAARDVTIVTKDVDFVTLVGQFGSPPQVLYMAFGNLYIAVLQAKLTETLPAALLRIAAGDPLVTID